MADEGKRRRFSLYLIKPSHYDDDGYVIQWWRSAIPSNTLAVLYGLATDCRERRILPAFVSARPAICAIRKVSPAWKYRRGQDECTRREKSRRA
jgi:hypothetical protein